MWDMSSPTLQNEGQTKQGIVDKHLPKQAPYLIVGTVTIAIPTYLAIAHYIKKKEPKEKPA